jgi:hypothetical protein
MFESAAAIAIILSSAWFTLVPEPTPADKETITASYMTNVGHGGWDLSLTQDKSVIDVAYQSKPTSVYGLRYGASAMLNGQGTYTVGPGVGKTIDVKGFDVTLFIYPSYSSIKGDDRIRSLSGNFNFRTTLDILYRLDDKTKLGVGLMHVSNGGYKEPNRGLDALRLTWGRDF